MCKPYRWVLQEIPHIEPVTLKSSGVGLAAMKKSGLSALILGVHTRPAGEVPFCAKFQSPWGTPPTTQVELLDTYYPSSTCLQDTVLLRAIGPRQDFQIPFVGICHHLRQACPQNQSLVQDTASVDCQQIPVGISLAVPSTSIENHSFQFNKSTNKGIDQDQLSWNMLKSIEVLRVGLGCFQSWCPGVGRFSTFADGLLHSLNFGWCRWCPIAIVWSLVQMLEVPVSGFAEAAP